MKLLSFVLLGLLAFNFAGCASVGSRVRERVSGPTYRTKVLQVDQRKAFEAARAALRPLGYTYVRGGAAQGKLEAMSGVMAPDGRGTARQVMLDVKISGVAEGGVQIAVLFSELVEDDFNKRPGQGTISPMYDTPLYEVYFRHIDEALTATK